MIANLYISFIRNYTHAFLVKGDRNIIWSRIITGLDKKVTSQKTGNGIVPLLDGVVWLLIGSKFGTRPASVYIKRRVSDCDRITLIIEPELEPSLGIVSVAGS